MGNGQTVKDAVAANLGIPFTVDIAGETLTVKLLDQASQGMLEDLLVSKKRKLLLADKQFLGDSDFGAVYNDFTDRVASGAYSFTSELMDKWLKSPEGSWTMLSVLSGKPVSFFKNISLNDPAEREIVSATVVRVWKDSFPNSYGPEEETETPGSAE